MARTKGQVRASKSKGAQAEYIVYDSLRKVYPDIQLTKQLGFVAQYDLIDHTSCYVYEVKRHKGFSWNELNKLYLKLIKHAPKYMDIKYKPFVIFKGNRQPWLVMFKLEQIGMCIVNAETFFKVEFKRDKEVQI